ncbi:MAG TPA: hypothetical protein VIM63_12265 [Rhodoferax sp.]
MSPSSPHGFSICSAGWLWDSYGAAFTFYGGAAFAVVALVVMGLRFGRDDSLIG